VKGSFPATSLDRWLAQIGQNLPAAKGWFWAFKSLSNRWLGNPAALQNPCHAWLDRL
jgi:hypothetical protein